MKRALDVVLALALLAVTLPLAVVVIVMVRVSLGSPVLFRQWRIGWRNRPFLLRKFRTMTDACDRQGVPLPDSARLTPVGRFLRSTSLDELPQLVSVLTGEMSLVGPRPLLPEYLPRYSARHARRHDVRPGLTGWAQVNGRAAAEWDDRLDLDVWYVEHQSLALDLKILLLTVARVVSRDDVTGPGNVPFEGSRR
jgi:lipopolysaccharide/colanic/teichoic acid biosynthesis glycosyltransferase